MLNFFRRRLVVLTVAAVFLLLTSHLIYTGTGTETGSAVADRPPSFIHGLLTGAHATSALQNALRTSVEYGEIPLLCLVVARTKSENTDWIQRHLPE